MATVRSLAERIAPTRTTSAFWKAVADSLSLNELDFPFFLCYSATNINANGTSNNGDGASSDTVSEVDSKSEHSSTTTAPSSQQQQQQQVRLDLVQSSIQPGHPAAPSQIYLDPLDTLENSGSSGTSWPFSKACYTRTSILAKNPHPHTPGFQTRGWSSDTPGDAVLIPIFGPNELLVGLVLFGLNTRRPYDAHYANFHQTIMQNLNASFVATQAFEREMKRREELQALDRAKTVFFQNVSHVCFGVLIRVYVHSCIDIHLLSQPRNSVPP